MGTTTYFTVDSEIMGESASGTIRNYVRDALGSVIAMTDTSGVELYSARYKPYGSTLASSGSRPSMTWNGIWGYLSVSTLPWVPKSVRYRFLSAETQSWTSTDPLWPIQPAYTYVNGNPTSSIDPYGLGADIPIVGNDPNSSCSTISLSTPGLVGWSIAFTYCRGCPCTSLAVSGSWGVTLSLFGSISQIQKDIERLINALTQTLDNVISGGVGLAPPSCPADPCRDQPPHHEQGEIEVCFNVCIGVGKLSGCVGIGVGMEGLFFVWDPPEYTSGFCYPPSASVSIVGEFDWC